MKFKLMVHQWNFSEEELIINPRDYNGLQVGDIVEIYHPEDTFSRLLLRVNKLSTDFQQKDTISIDQTVASVFQLRAYLDVYVKRIEASEVTLDMVEIVFKDQYFSRSDMWRLQKSLTDSCVYIGKKLTFSGLRLQVHELRVNEEKLACGVIGSDTKVVFRSQSAQMHIFIQMSTEMWEFDFFGDLYFEKTVNGLLSELFGMWKENNCNHEVTIVMFSRTYYDALSLDDFPKEMQSCVTKMPKGKFYQDFYKVIINSEHIDDWNLVAMKLKTNFNSYLSWVGCDSEKLKNQPLGSNSRSTDGNVLEALNVSLNVFETFFIDVNLERTNSTCVLITPGCGVFDVDKELLGMTNQRLLDVGFGMDLVCLAEQPLHAVPLLKFHKKQPRFRDQHTPIYEYAIPQWINHSFYRSPQQRNSTSRFIPRMKLPERPIVIDEETGIPEEKQEKSHPQSEIDFDDHDAQVFTYTTPRSTSRSRITRGIHTKKKGDLFGTRRSSPDVLGIKGKPDNKTHGSWNENNHETSHKPPLFRAFSENDDIRLGSSFDNVMQTEDTTGGDSDSSLDIDSPFKASGLCVTANKDIDPAYHSGLINPFKPYHLSYKLTLFRHLWLHAFPTDASGEAVQEHHLKVPMDQDGISPSPFDVEEWNMSVTDGQKSYENFEQDSLRSLKNGRAADSLENQKTALLKTVGSERSLHSGVSDQYLLQRDPNRTTTILTGVAWKSLSIPACFPLTTDYFPDQKTFEDHFFWYNYNVIMDDSYVRPITDENSQMTDRFKMTPKEKFHEAISQRILQGFQFVKNRKKLKFLLSPSKSSAPSLFQRLNERPKEEYVLSHAQQIHVMQFNDQELTVNKYVKKKPSTTKPIEYKYKLWPTNSSEFHCAYTLFSHDDTTNYNWNYLDRYVTGEGDDCNMLLEDMKYWRIRFLLLPKRDQSNESTKYSGDTKMIEIEGFLKFIEGLNGIKRPVNQRMLFICRKHTAEDQKTYMERRVQISDENKKKGDRSESEGTPKSKATPNGSQKKSTPVKDSPSENQEKRHKRNVSMTTEEIHDDRKSVSSERQGSSHSDDANAQSHAIPAKMPPEHALTWDSPLEDIVKAMQNEEYGLCFLPEQAGLRQWTFISAEAVAWMIKSIDGIDGKQCAVQLGQKMLDSKLIMHASQSEAQCFVDGMYLFFVKSAEKTDEKNEKSRKISLFTSFGTKRTEEELLMSYNIKWFEVEVWRGKPPDGVPEYMKEPLAEASPLKSPTSPNKEKRSRAASLTPPGKPMYKSMEYCLDSNRRSDRTEWCTIYYHDNYCPDQSFSLELHWMVSTASIINERIQHWARRAIACGFHLVPAPVQPLTIHCNYHSLTFKKNPLNKPNFIPLNIECLLTPGRKHIFEEFDPSTWNSRVVQFQEAILFRFGFLKDFPRETSTFGMSFVQKRETHSYQYVHWSGSIFVRIVDEPVKSDTLPSPSARKINLEESDEHESSSYEDSSERVHLKVNSVLKDLINDFDNEKFPTGFFWSLNFSLSKKWRSSYNDDSSIALKLMADFSNFCSNKDGLLERFWQINHRTAEDVTENQTESETIR